MKKGLFNAASAVVLAALATGLLTIGLGGTASAAAPPWEPDPGSVGALVFYNAAGQQITGGNLTDSPIAAYVEGTTTLRSGDTTATLYGYLPVSGEPTSEWSGLQLGGSPTFPNAGAPTPLNTATLPVETGASGNDTISNLETVYPNNGTGSYAGTYELRLYTGASGKSQTTAYDSADISITGSTWSVEYPAPTLTSTTTTVTAPTGTLSASNGSGATATLSASVSPAVAGTVQFTVNGTTVGSPVPETTGTASLASQTLGIGSDSVGAVFTPGAFLGYSGSTATPVSVTVNPPAPDSTSTTVSAPTSGTSVNEFQSVPLTATVFDSTIGNNTQINSGFGSVVFYANPTDSTTVTGTTATLGTAPVGSGGQASATYSGGFSTSGPQYIFAVFTPADGGLSYASYTGSTSSTSSLTVNASSLGSGQNVETSVQAGTLTITTPYTQGSPLNLGTAVLNGAGSEFTASAAFGGSNAPVTITDTRGGATGWTATATATDFTGDSTSNSGKSINAQNLSLNNVAAVQVQGNTLSSSSVTPSNVPTAATSPYAPGVAGTDGLSGGGAGGNGGSQHTFAAISGTSSVGSVSITGTVNLIAPTSTPAGLYGATLTLTVA
jgi:hypothetical protein